jgi:very-short-patch-repair endonuclease
MVAVSLKNEGKRKRPMPHALLARCRELRKNATDAEKLLWQLLRDRRLLGFKFHRQYPMASYILDFYCHEAKLAIEVDGGGHADDQQAAYDAQRTKDLQAEGIRVIRFWNNEVLNQTETVLTAIAAALSE